MMMPQKTQDSVQFSSYIYTAHALTD